MPRKPASAEQVRKMCDDHIYDASAAAATLANPATSADDRIAAAKTLEAAGCYIRRAIARGAF